MQMLSCSRPSLRQDQPRHSRHLSLRSKRVSLLNCFEFLLGSNCFGKARLEDFTFSQRSIEKQH